MRYAAKIDASQHEIVNALRECGVMVWIIREPCDLLTFYRDRWLPLECKPKGWRPRKDQEAQNAFLKVTGVQVAKTAEEAVWIVCKGWKYETPDTVRDASGVLGRIGGNGVRPVSG